MLNPFNLISKIFKSSNQKKLDNLDKVEKRINNYSQGTESFVINSINLLQDFLLDLNSKPTSTKRDKSKKKGG